MTSWNLISATGHSGSTLLDMLIGSHSECITLGEIHQLTLKAKGVCACGAANYKECSFWRDIDLRLQSDGGLELSELHVDSCHQDEFRRSNHALLSVLQEKTKARWFVDSSKKLTRLKSLLADSSINVLPIHIVRRPGVSSAQIWQREEDFFSSLRSIILAFGPDISYL